MESLPKINTELFIIPHKKNSYIIYAPLRKSAFVANAKVVNLLANLKYRRQNYTIDNSLVAILRNLDIISKNREKIPISKFRDKPKSTEITLFLTTNCNLRCSYCYADSGSTRKKFMQIDIAKRGIDFIVKNAVKKKERQIKLNFHGGGEPTTNWEVMKWVHNYANQQANNYNIKVISSLATNGVLNDDQTKWIIKNISGCSVSFDGLPEIHDRYRTMVTGLGSSKYVIKTLHEFDRVKFQYGIRLTVTHDSIEKLPNSIKYISTNFNPARILAEPVYKINKWKNAPSAETKNFVNAFREAKSLARSYGKNLLFSAARLNLLTNHYCGISQDSFSLTPDGNVTGCYEAFSEDVEYAKLFFYGKPNETNGFEFDMYKLNKLRNHTVDKMKFCEGCFSKWHCAGDCYYKSLSVNNENEFRGSDRCFITRELIKDQILEKIYFNGGIYWHE